MSDHPSRSIRGELRDGAYVVLGFVALVWVIELINLIVGHRLGVFGIHPRTLTGLPGIVLAPFLHASLAHVLANTVAFLILGSLVVLHGVATFVQVTAWIILVGDSLVWLLARDALHVGASGLVMGYFGFLLARAWYERSVGSLLLAIVAVAVYGGAVWGALPLVRSGISWEMHLFGLLAGMLAARLGSVGGHRRSVQDELLA